MNTPTHSSSFNAHDEIQFLGDLEPIDQAGRHSTPDRRDISIRWFIGSILAGVTSVVLMGGALLAALDGKQKLAVPAASITGSLTSTNRQASRPSIAKGNRIGLNLEVSDTTSDVMMVSTVKREGNRDVVKVRPFLHVTAPLAIALKREIKYPRFNPLTVFSESGKAEPIAISSDSIYGAEVESDVLIQIFDYPYASKDISNNQQLRTVEIEQFVRRAGPGLTVDVTTVTAIASIDPDRFSISGEDSILPSNVIITAENVTVIAMNDPASRNYDHYQDRIIRVQVESQLIQLLQNEGMDPAEALLIERSLSADLDGSTLKRGDSVRLAFRHNRPTLTDAQKNGENNDVVIAASIKVDRISIYRGASHLVSIARSDKENFVYSREPARVPRMALGVGNKPIVSTNRLPNAYDGINRAAISQGLTKDLARLLVHVFAFDVDFRKKISPTDELSVFVSLEDGKTKPGADSEILYTSIKLGDLKRKYYRFRDAKSGRVDYYDETGKSAKKFLLRKPVPNAKFGSRFGFRRHPISRIRKMHWGVDWTAPRGTPIIAAGNGVVEKAGWSGGYGRQTVLRHSNGYKSIYSHQTRFAKGVRPGIRVRQGQIIGYVGTTGYSTGPHLHFEVTVNGRKVNPMRIRLPKGKTLKNEELERFEAERDRINALLEKREKDKTRLALN